MMFSSTIIGLKLLPTTALHHRHLGEVIISVLLLQDLLAIVLLVAVEAMGHEQLTALQAARIAVAPALRRVRARSRAHPSARRRRPAPRPRVPARS